jgi:hypothetical protein
VTKLTKKMAVPHGVVFLYDPTMVVDVPEDTGAAPILHTDNCVSIWTLGEYEGAVSLTLSDEAVDACGDAVFEGFVETEGRRLAFNDSGVNPILDLAVPATRTRVTLFTSDPSYPDSVTCLVHADPDHASN